MASMWGQEFTKGGLVKGSLAIYVVPLCICNALGSVFDAQIENVPRSIVAVGTELDTIS